MNQDTLNKYKLKLEGERNLVTEEIMRNEKPVSFGDDVDHLEEKADESEEVGNRLAMVEGLKERLADINLALEKMREGTYGICEKCGKPIEEEILEIDPESRFCKKDKVGK